MRRGKGETPVMCSFRQGSFRGLRNQSYAGAAAVSSAGGTPTGRPDPAVLARLSSYLTASGGNLRRALALYDWNTRASAAVLATSAMVEVIVRNALDVSFQQWADQRRGGGDWLNAAPLDAQGQSDVIKARERATRRGGDLNRRRCRLERAGEERPRCRAVAAFGDQDVDDLPMLSTAR